MPVTERNLGLRAPGQRPPLCADRATAHSADGSSHPRRRGHDRRRNRQPPDAIGPRIAAAAVGAIAMEVIDTEPGTEREEAVAAAMRFLEAGTAAL